MNLQSAAKAQRKAHWFYAERKTTEIQNKIFRTLEVKTLKVERIFRQPGQCEQRKGVMK